MDHVDTSRGKSYSFGIVTKDQSLYRIELVGKTGDNDLAQVNVSVSYNGVNIAVLCWNGTHGAYETKGLSMDRPLNRNVVVNLYFAQSGLTLKEFKITKIKDNN